MLSIFTKTKNVHIFSTALDKKD